MNILHIILLILLLYYLCNQSKMEHLDNTCVENTFKQSVDVIIITPYLEKIKIIRDKIAGQSIGNDLGKLDENELKLKKLNSSEIEKINKQIIEKINSNITLKDDNKIKINKLIETFIKERINNNIIDNYLVKFKKIANNDTSQFEQCKSLNEYICKDIKKHILKLIPDQLDVASNSLLNEFKNDILPNIDGNCKTNFEYKIPNELELNLSDDEKNELNFNKRLNELKQDREELRNSINNTNWTDDEVWGNENNVREFLKKSGETKRDSAKPKISSDYLDVQRRKDPHHDWSLWNNSRLKRKMELGYTDSEMLRKSNREIYKFCKEKKDKAEIAHYDVLDAMTELRKKIALSRTKRDDLRNCWYKRRY
jgi:hypothetical protein